MEKNSQKMVVLFTTIIILASCGGDQSSSYQRIIERFEPEIRAYFPDHIEAEVVNARFNIEPYLNENVGEVVYIYIECTPKNFDLILHEVRSKSLANYKFNDECNIIPYKFQKDTGYRSCVGKEWLYEGWIKDIQECSQDNFPIPNFVGVGEGEYEYKQGLSDEYDIYVLESKSGKYFSKKYYGPNIIMPPEWRNGHSYGAAINENIRKVIYWLVIW